jgi:hypothetical protein
MRGAAALITVIATVALALLGCGGSDGTSSGDYRLVTAPSGATYAFALIGPLSLDIETVSGTRCFMVRAIRGTDPSVHGVIWPYGTTTDGDSLMVPGLAAPLRNGDTFWAGGSGPSEGNPPLGPCGTASVYFLGPTAFPTDPRATPLAGSS